MTGLVYKNIFEAITDDPTEAAELEFRSDVMIFLREYFRVKKMTPTEISKVLEVQQPRVSELMRGKIALLSTNTLIGYLARIGIRLRPVYQPTRGGKPPMKCEVQACTA